MVSRESAPRFLLITYPAQGLINPALQLAKRLIRINTNSQVTFLTTTFAHRRMTKAAATTTENSTINSTPNGMSFSTFSDGFDDGFDDSLLDNFDRYDAELRRRGTRALTDLIVSAAANEGRPFTCVVYTLLFPWAADVAAEHGVPAAMLWAQPATVFGVFYYYFLEHGDVIRENSENASLSLSFPGLPLLTIRDLPSLLDPSKSHSSFVKFYREQFEQLAREPHPKILANTFEALEPEALRVVGGASQKLSLIGIGPLIPSAFSDEKDLSETRFGGDLFERSKKTDDNDIIEWLNSKPKATVVYLSFGSYSVPSKPQMEEIAKGLLEFRHPFLWVIREKKKDLVKREITGDINDDEVSCREKLEKLGKIVPWCSQVEILSNPSLGCFLSHCGWNSTMESLACGVPMVAFPQWTDQITNAKLIEDVWGIGVKVQPNEEGIVEGKEIKRCLELVMGGGKENGVELRRNARKWKDLAREAVKEGGSSDKNLKAFVAERSLKE